ncbi:MAG: ferritin family protein [Desulfobacterales bacterium]|jgi:rubrerythrin|nr:ferritin family protein [Desulfobacteraceae bacterium]MDY0312399.1 ferritin family protein [Desulfobacterales bacterium]
MTANTQERIEALEVALNNEEQEAAFYQKHAERTTDPLGKKMFETLAADEREHYQRIQALHQKLKEDGKWPETLPLTVKGTKVRDVLKSVVEAVDSSPENRTSDMEAVKIAIAFEAKGEAHYKKLREAADDPVEKSFYGMLETMEREHRLSLEDTYEYFKDPQAWFQRMEKHGLDGA